MIFEIEASVADLKIFKQSDFSDETDNGLGQVYWGLGFLSNNIIFVEENRLLVDTDCQLFKYKNGVFIFKDTKHQFVVDVETKNIMEFNIIRDAELVYNALVA